MGGAVGRTPSRDHSLSSSSTTVLFRCLKNRLLGLLISCCLLLSEKQLLPRINLYSKQIDTSTSAYKLTSLLKDCGIYTHSPKLIFDTLHNQILSTRKDLSISLLLYYILPKTNNHRIS